MENFIQELSCIRGEEEDFSLIPYSNFYVGSESIVEKCSSRNHTERNEMVRWDKVNHFVGREMYQSS